MSDFRCEECGHMVDAPQHARGCMAGIGPDVQRVLTQGEFARLERENAELHTRLAQANSLLWHAVRTQFQGGEGHAYWVKAQRFYLGLEG